MKTCRKCGEEKPLSEYSNHPSTKDLKHAWCKACVRKAAKKHARDIASGKKKKKKRYRTKTYGKIVRQRSTHVHRARAINPDAPMDTDIDLRKLFYRDGGICGVCKKRVKSGDGSIDHVIPLERGGTHTWDNVQLTHKVCNLKKGIK